MDRLDESRTSARRTHEIRKTITSTSSVTFASPPSEQYPQAHDRQAHMAHNNITLCACWNTLDAVDVRARPDMKRMVTFLS